MRTLAITQNVTVDGSIEMLGDWFDPQGRPDQDTTDLIEELHRQDRAADAVVLGRSTFEDMRGYWPQQTDDQTGITDYLNRVQKYVVTTTMTDPQWQNTTVLSGEPAVELRAMKEQPGRDIVVTGSITLCHALIGAGLVDEYRLFVTRPGSATPQRPHGGCGLFGSEVVHEAELVAERVLHDGPVDPRGVVAVASGTGVQTGRLLHGPRATLGSITDLG